VAKPCGALICGRAVFSHDLRSELSQSVGRKYAKTSLGAFQELGSENLAKGLHALIERGDRDSVNRYVVMTETSYPFFAEEIQKYQENDF
jgi:hypothetical protein